MSSIKRQKTCFNSCSQNSQSFSERICDDLSEVILQYLSLEDKLKLECVSKQFQRTVFQKQYALSINLFKSKGLFKKKRFEFIGIKSLESLLEKCPNITSIEILDYIHRGFKFYNYDEFIALITKYCNHLLEFKAPLTPISETVFNEFYQKFYKQLKEIEEFVSGSVERHIRFENIETLKFSLLDASHIDIICGLNLVNLRRLKASFNSTVGLELMNKLFVKFKNIRYLDLDFTSIKDYYKETENLILKNVSELKNLIELKVRSRNGLNDTFFADSLKRMANNCPKLKSINCIITETEENASKGLLTRLKNFKQLKRLHLIIICQRMNGIPEDVPVFSFDTFNGFPNITHLKFHLVIYLFADNLLTKIDNYLPKLQSLKCFGGSLEGTPEEATQMADHLSRLSNLEAIKIQSNNQLFCLQFKNEIIKKCRKIKTINLGCYNDMEESLNN